MMMLECPNCNKLTGFKRALGFGTFIMCLLTFGVWIFVIPFYPARCITCGLRRQAALVANPRNLLALIPAAVAIVALIAFLYFGNRTNAAVDVKESDLPHHSVHMSDAMPVKPNIVKVPIASHIYGIKEFISEVGDDPQKIATLESRNVILKGLHGKLTTDTETGAYLLPFMDEGDPESFVVCHINSSEIPDLTRDSNAGLLVVSASSASMSQGVIFFNDCHYQGTFYGDTTATSPMTTN